MALVSTNPDKIKIYLFNSETKTDWKVGSPVTLSRMSADKEYVDNGKILKVVSHKLLEFSCFCSRKDMQIYLQTILLPLTGWKKENDKSITLTYLGEHTPVEFDQKN